MVTVESSYPKFAPCTVTLKPPLAGALNVLRKLCTGESYVNHWCSVPIILETVMTRVCPFGKRIPEADSRSQVTVVSDVQVVDRQVLTPSFCVGVVSDGPKLKPVRVRLLPIEGGRLMPCSESLWRKDTVGASYVNVSMDVPTTAMTVNDARYDVPYGVVDTSHVTVVELDHAAVVHESSSRYDDGV
jgi:hypothetical protein